MPLYKRCCICGRLCSEKPYSAYPYKQNGYACNECYITQVIPSKKWKESKGNRYERK